GGATGGTVSVHIVTVVWSVHARPSSHSTASNRALLGSAGGKGPAMSSYDQTKAEALDEDELDGETMPPDEPFGVDDYGTTAAEERYGEPLDEFIQREEPEGVEADDGSTPALACQRLRELVTAEAKTLGRTFPPA